MATQQKGFMDYVQEHERNWGTRAYRGRPDLVHIIQAKVVVFWEILKDEDEAIEKSIRARRAALATPDEEYMITLHNDLEEIAEYLVKQVFRSRYGSNTKRISRIYRGQKPVRIKDVKITFEEGEPE
ncbi:MAG: hypothetical protein ACPG7F_12670 [Aggregatilineales bacterium]